MTTPKPIQFTEKERAELTASCVSIIGKLRKDKHVTKEEMEFWQNLADKLIRAKI